MLREKYGRFFGLCQLLFSDFFDQFDWQGLCHLRGLLIAHTLNPEEEAIQDAEIFVWHDRFALGDFGLVRGMPVRNGKVFSGAEHGGGSGVGHGIKLADFRGVARKKFFIFQQFPK